MPIDEKQARRLNIMIGEGLFAWVAETAEERGQSVSALIREALERERRRETEDRLRRASEELAGLYRDDTELRAFRALDAEDFA